MLRLAASAIALLTLALAATGCATTSAPPAVGPAAHQTLEFDDELRTVAVRVVFEPIAPRRLRVERPSAVTVARAQPSDATLTFDSEGVADVPRGTTGVTLVVDLSRLPWSDFQRDADCVLIDPSALLCRAAEGPPLSITASARAPHDAVVSVPWQLDGGSGEVPATAFLNFGRMAVGRTDPIICRAGPTEIECAVTAPLLASRDEIVRCITAAADAALPLAGDARPERIFVVMRPAAGRSDGVLFGETMYGGGPTVLLLVGADTDGAALHGEWVIVHEMVHIAMPRVNRADAWFSEGLATYYQNALRARAGMLDEQDAWDELTAGIARGRAGAGRHTLESDSRYMGERHAYQRVYWSGAAIAMLWDVELRRAHGRTLDDALRDAARTFPPGGQPIPAATLIAHMDAWAGDAIFSRIADEWLASREFPDVASALGSLGIDGPFLNDSAPDAPLRRAITGR